MKTTTMVRFLDPPALSNEDLEEIAQAVLKEFYNETITPMLPHAMTAWMYGNFQEIEEIRTLEFKLEGTNVVLNRILN